jgi:ATP-dependent exoDNAse (exonuclease V) beta subunit
MLGDMASLTTLHGYGESLFNKWGMQAPDLAKTRFVEDLHKELTSKYVLATELLVYSLELRMAGQVDLLMRNEDSTEYHILDYKFIKEPLERKSYYNRFTQMMSGPFSRLMDTNYSHYSIQLEIYRYLMGAVGRKVKTKRLMVVTQKATSLFTRSR